MIRRQSSFVLILVLLALAGGPTAPAGAARPAADVEAPALTGAIPPIFVADPGGPEGPARFIALGAGGRAWLTADAIRLAVTAPASEAPARATALLTLRFAGGGAAPTLEPFGPRPGRVSFLFGDDAGQWRADLPAWSGVAYRGVYPGVDLEVHGVDGRLAWRWVTHAGARPPAAPLLVEGGAADGRLAVDTGSGEVRLIPPPVVAATATGGLTTGQLAMSTLLGGSDSDVPHGVAVDPSGAVYVAGRTFSMNFPTTPGARDTTWNGGTSIVIDEDDQDIFVAKFDPAGHTLLYATYIGGALADQGRALAVDAAGAAYVAGRTASTNFPVTRGAFRERHAGGRMDAVVFKLSPAGDALLWSSYLGGSPTYDPASRRDVPGTGNDAAHAVAVDAAGAAYVAGTTTAQDFPLAGVAGPPYLGAGDAFVAKLNPAGSGLVWSSYLGGPPNLDENGEPIVGTGVDEANAIAVDSGGAAYVTGVTTSVGFPVTPGAAQPTMGGVADAFVAKFGPDGGRAWSGHLGGSQADAANGVAVDRQGAVYVTGGTASADFPTTGGAAQPAFGGATDAFAVKLNPSGAGRVYSTFLGGAGEDGADALAVDAAGAVTLTGHTGSADFPVAGGAVQATYAGGDDAFVTQVSPAGGGWQFSTFLGGSSDDYGRAITLGGGGAVYVAGSTGSSAFPTTPGAYQGRNRGNSDAFVTRLALGGGAPAPLPTIVRDGHIGAGAPAAAPAWYFAEGYTAPGFDEHLVIFNPGAAGAATISYFVEGRGAPVVRDVPLAAAARTIIRVHEAASAANPGGLGRLSAGHGTRVEATTPVVVERPMYFETPSTAGGHIALGALAPARAWYFAEGYTAPGFDQYLTILNPNPRAADVTITYYLAAGAPKVVRLRVPAAGRSTVAVHDPAQGVGRGQAVSAKVETDLAGGGVVERPIYFTYGGGVMGGHNAMGATAPRLSWLFAEGYTGAGFDEYLTILNPEDRPAAVTLTYVLPRAAPVTRQVTVPAAGRYTVTVHDEREGVGRGREVSARVDATNGVPIVVERPIYFAYGLDGGGPITGGHNLAGIAVPARTWTFAEGSTVAGFDEYLTILNSGPAGIATIAYYVDGRATPVTRTVALPASSRTTVAVHLDPSPSNPGGLGRLGGHATVVTSTIPVVVERPMYFAYETAF